MSATTQAPDAQAEQNGAGQTQLDPDELFIDGDGKLTSKPGGKAPTTASVRIKGRKIDLNREYEKGDVLTVTLELEVRGVHFDDQVDASTGQVIGCERKHIVHPVGLTVE